MVFLKRLLIFLVFFLVLFFVSVSVYIKVYGKNSSKVNSVDTEYGLTGVVVRMKL